MKKHFLVALAVIFCLSSILAGCSSSKRDRRKDRDRDDRDDKPSTSETTEAFTENTDVTEETTEATEETTEATEETTEAAEETTEAIEETTEAVEETTEAAEGNDPAAENSDVQFVNLDNMQFTVNGITYTLGQTTLQEMIDDGVPFREDDVANANNNLNKNTQSQGFRIDLGEYWTAQVYAFNDTDGNMTTADCYINEIYLPNHDDETQDILSFAFPLDLTIEDLKANAGEPTDYDYYESDDSDYYSETLEYTKDSTKYYGDCGYEFEFVRGKLAYLYIEYLP